MSSTSLLVALLLVVGTFSMRLEGMPINITFTGVGGNFVTVRGI